MWWMHTIFWSQIQLITWMCQSEWVNKKSNQHLTRWKSLWNSYIIWYVLILFCVLSNLYSIVEFLFQVDSLSKQSGRILGHGNQCLIRSMKEMIDEIISLQNRTSTDIPYFAHTKLPLDQDTVTVAIQMAYPLLAAQIFQWINQQGIGSPSLFIV